MTAAGAPALRRCLAAFGLAAGAVVLVPVYTANPQLGFVWETSSAGLAAQSLAREGDLGVEEFFPLARPGTRIGYALEWRGAHLVSIEPTASIATFAPFFLPRRDAAPATRGPEPLHNRVAAEVTIATLAVLAVWLAALSTPARAALVVVVLALATSYRTISATGPWQHTSAGLWLALGLLAWSRAPRRPGLYPVAAAALALAAACRPIFAGVPLLLLVDVWRPGRAPRGAALAATGAAAALGALTLGANVLLHGSPLGGRAPFVADPERFHAVGSYFAFSPLHWAGLLVSPSRGLFVFSPVLLFALPGLVRSLRGDAPPPWRAISLAGLLTFFLYGGVATWWAGSVYGPRYTTDLLPFFGFWLALTPLPRRGRAAAAALFAAALVWSVGVHAIGVRAYPCGWNAFPASIDRAPERAWSLRDTQIGRCAQRAQRLWSGAP